MTKDSKTVSTIRRKKGKQVAFALQKIKEENPKPSYTSEEEITAADVEDKCYLFDDRVLGPMTLRWLMSNNNSLFLTLLAIRFANALVIQTQYVPDEYWQSLEVSHNMVFGYGYLTWEWKEGLRGYSYPLLFAVLYKVLHFLELDSRVMLIKAPRLLQGVIAAWGDLCLYKLSSKLSGRATAQWTLLCQLLSWFTIYCCTRTLSNSVETVLITAALSYFPWPHYSSLPHWTELWKMQWKPKDLYKFLALAALSVVNRPTAAVVWILLCSWHLQRVYGSTAFPGVVKAYLWIGCLSFGASTIVDRIWYGKWTFVHLNFLWFNVVSGGASFYGVHPWHWYFLQGFPVVMGTLIFSFVVGAWRAKNKTLLWILLWILATHSLLPHKEFRFIMPTIPLACHYCGVYFQSLCTRPPVKKFRLLKKQPASTEGIVPEKNDAGNVEEAASMKSKSDVMSCQPLGESDNEKTEGSFQHSVDPVMTGLAVKNQAKLGALKKGSGDADVMEKSFTTEVEDNSFSSETLESRLKERTTVASEKEDMAQEQSPETLRDQHHEQNLQKAKLFVIVLVVTNILPALYFCLIHQRGTVSVTKFLHDASVNQRNTDVLFLMPCHSTPYYSYIHRNISMRFLTCEPNLNGVLNYTDEADLFYQDPQEWLRQEYLQSKRAWPSIVVYFDNLHKDINSILVQGGYNPCAVFFHTHIPEGRVGSYVWVSCR